MIFPPERQIDVAILTTDKRFKRGVHEPLAESLEAFGITPEYYFGEDVKGTYNSKGIRIQKKKLALMGAWHAMFDDLLVPSLGIQNYGLLVFEDDTVLDSLFEHNIRAVLSHLPWKLNMLALGTKAVYKSTSHTTLREWEPFDLEACQWTGNLCNYLTKEGVQNVAKWLPKEYEKQADMIRLEKALDLTWSKWPGVYRLTTPLVTHSERAMEISR